MSGVLNSKKRVLDVVLTELGRQQMNRGEFSVSFVSFSDKGSEYAYNAETDVASDITDRLYFEAYSSPSDEIIPEVDNVGDFLLTKKVSDTLTVDNYGNLQETTPDGFTQVDGFANISSFQSILTSRYDSLQILRSTNPVADFTINKEAIDLNLKKNLKGPADISYSKPMLIDDRFSGMLNTMFLPPTSVVGGERVPLKAYNQYGKPNTKDNILTEITNKTQAVTTVDLGTDETYKKYNILGQAFMKKNQSVKKYIVVDGGEYKNERGAVDTHVYHLGFVYKDEIGTSKFSRAFSLVFREKDTQFYTIPGEE